MTQITSPFVSLTMTDLGSLPNQFRREFFLRRYS